MRISYVILIIAFMYSNFAWAQAPDKMSYQAVIRNANDQLLENQEVKLRISILSNSVNGNIIFSETHQLQTNDNGLISLEIGGGIPEIGTLENINWANGEYFIQTESDPTGGNNYTISGISPLLSVPYALHAKTAQNGDKIVTIVGEGPVSVTGAYPNFKISSTDENTIYQEGEGIDIDGNTIINTAPDREITLTGTGSTTISGSYPNYTISSSSGSISYSAGFGIDINNNEIINTAPDQEITLIGSGATKITGSYPDFIINSTDENTLYDAGDGIEINGTTIVNISPDRTITLNEGDGISISGAYPDYTISLVNSNGHFVGEFYGGGIVFYTYDNGQHGLIVSLQDLGSTSSWSRTNSTSSAKSHFEGKENTSQIIASQGSGTYAALLCDDYSEGGFSDWFLPSVWELNLLHQNAFLVSFKLSEDNDSETEPLISDESYWSSTEFDKDLSYMIYFADGTTYVASKNDRYRIRAIRRF